LFRFSGSFLLRFDARTFCGLLFQDPPRKTPSATLRCSECKRFEEFLAQTPGIAVPRVTEPSLNAALDPREIEFSALVKARDSTQPAPHGDGLGTRQTRPPRE
jgi:hypothetical protein